jgi:ribokinase
MKTITILGSINYDLVTRAQRAPEAGETVHAVGFDTHHGGKGANQALAARRLSPKDAINVQMVGRLGDDGFGKELFESMKKEGIDMNNVSVISGERTGVATIIVEDSGENRILVYPGANGTFSPDYVTGELFDDTDILILQNEIPFDVVHKALKLAKSKNITTIYNPSPVCDLNSELFECISYLIVNESEAQYLCKAGNDTSPKEMMPHLHSLGADSVIVTHGGNGSYFQMRDGCSNFVPACKVEKVVDTTGAGDTFLGGLASQLVQGTSLEESIKFASKAAAIAVTREGAAEGIPYLSEVN